MNINNDAFLLCTELLAREESQTYNICLASPESRQHFPDYIQYREIDTPVILINKGILVKSRTHPPLMAVNMDTYIPLSPVGYYCVELDKELAHKFVNNKARPLVDKVEKMNQFCGIRNYTFWLTINDLSEYTVDLGSDRGSNNMFHLFNFLLERWKMFGKFEDQYKSIIVNDSEVVNYMKRATNKDVDSYWIKNTVGNLNDKKFKPRNLDMYVRLSRVPGGSTKLDIFIAS
jgi:hypothetical protein